MEEQIKSFIFETFMFSEGNLENNEPLFESGIIDSLGFIKLLAFIEKTFGVSIAMSEVTMEKFSTINDIVKIIKEKLDM